MDDLKLTILEKLYRAGIIGERHTTIESAVRGLPRHLKGDAMKAVKDLIKEGLIVPKPTSYGMQISLNPNKVKQIRALIGDFSN
ncbi:MAG: hypothetical protein HYU02_08710 [Thaumarchaeota archaeon]|nr:hypothetical protein [Nitrososphaerota archaeon]